MSSRKVRWPAIPEGAITDSGIVRILAAMRERLQIFSRERGRVEDSVVTIRDLIELELIRPEDLAKLSGRTIDE